MKNAFLLLLLLLPKTRLSLLVLEDKAALLYVLVVRVVLLKSESRLMNDAGCVPADARRLWRCAVGGHACVGCMPFSFHGDRQMTASCVVGG